MEFTGELPDSEVVSAVVEWADSELDDRISTYLSDSNHTSDVEGAIRELLDDFTPGGGGCRTARAFEEAVNGILDHRGELVLKPANDALAEMVTKEVEKQVTIMVVNIQRGLRRLHPQNIADAGGPEVAGAV